MRRILRLVLVQGLAVVVLLELALRLLAPVSGSVRARLTLPQDGLDFSSVESTPELLQRSVSGYRPGQERTGYVSNSRGFRTPEYELERNPGMRRIVLLGDSFTFSSGGVPHATHWPTLLRQELGDEVINLGVPAVGPLFLRRLWELEGARLEPDVVVLAFFVGNDFTQDRWAPKDDLLSRCVRSSAVLRLTRNLISGSAGPPYVAPGPVVETGARGGHAVPGYEQRFAARDPLLPPEELLAFEVYASVVCDRRQTESFEGLLESTASLLSRLRTDVESTGASFLLVLVPDRFQLDEEMRRAIEARVGHADFDWDRPQRRLAERLLCLDLLPALRADGRGAALYNEGDTHWSPAGNAVVAPVIADALRSSPPAPPPSR